jgi:hypothetical protein
MAFDLGSSMRKKEEFESARLMDFEFRSRARATRLLATMIGLDERDASALIAECYEHAVLDRLATMSGRDLAFLSDQYERCLAAARHTLIAERGDPTPHKLA